MPLGNPPPVLGQEFFGWLVCASDELGVDFAPIDEGGTPDKYLEPLLSDLPYAIPKDLRVYYEHCWVLGMWRDAHEVWEKVKGIVRAALGEHLSMLPIDLSSLAGNHTVAAIYGKDRYEIVLRRGKTIRRCGTDLRKYLVGLVKHELAERDELLASHVRSIAELAGEREAFEQSAKAAASLIDESCIDPLRSSLCCPPDQPSNLGSVTKPADHWQSACKAAVIEILYNFRGVAVPALQDLLSHEDDNVQSLASDALARLDSEGIEADAIGPRPPGRKAESSSS